MGQKVAGIGGKPTGAREPAPQRPPGETPEPPEERTKEATAGRITELEGNTGRGRERPVFLDSPKWLYQGFQVTPGTAPHPSFGVLGAGGNHVQSPSPRPAPGMAVPRHRGQAPRTHSQPSLPRTARRGSLGSYFKTCNEHTEPAPLSALAQRAKPGAAGRRGRGEGRGQGPGSSETIVRGGYSRDKKHLAKRAEVSPSEPPRFWPWLPGEMFLQTQVADSNNRAPRATESPSPES